MGYWLPSVNGVFDANLQQAHLGVPKGERAATDRRDRHSDPGPLPHRGRPTPRSRSGNLIEVDKTRQIVMVVRNGSAVWTFNASSGSEQPYFSTADGRTEIAHTPEGVFSFVSQIDGADNAPLGLLWRPKFFTYQGHAIHGGGSVPPYPASHGCVRVSNAAIDWMWANNILPLGETVWVYR